MKNLNDQLLRIALALIISSSAFGAEPKLPIPQVSLENSRITGVFHENGVDFVLRATARVETSKGGSLELLSGVEVLFLDALRYKPHRTHSTIETSMKTVERLRVKRAYFTHLSHDVGHERAESLLPAHVRLAYDGLEVRVEIPGA